MTSDLRRFTNQVAVVTGGAHGIGSAVALRLASEGADLVVADIDLKGAEVVADRIRSRSGNAIAVSLDVTSRIEVEAMLAAATARFGRIDILCNVAGVLTVEDFLLISDDAWNRTLNVNLTGTLLCAQVVSRYMSASKIAGRIVNMASTNGLEAEASVAAYNTSKFAVVGLTKTMALELAEMNIRVNSVCPGLIKTRMNEDYWSDPVWAKEYLSNIPLGRFGEPEDVASAVAFLASTDSGSITGLQLIVDGGQLASSH